MKAQVELGLDPAVSRDDVEDAARAAAFVLVNLVPAGPAHPAQAIFTRDGGATVLYFVEGAAAERRLVISGADAERAASDLRRAFEGGAQCGDVGLSDGGAGDDTRQDGGGR
ncbi:MAG: hypothetical protein WKG00_38350 [Polyangiaceae bacterium]